MTTSERSFKDTLDPILGLIHRGRWYILSIATLTAVGMVALLYQLPNRYTSEATLFVVQQQVPQRYVTPTSTTELAEALPAMTQEVLSRNRMLELADQFDLFPTKRHHLAPEQVEALIREYLTIEPLPPTEGHREANAFKISFGASSAILAQEVTSRLTSLFIQENLKTREDQARNTNDFLQTHLEAAKEKLARQEELLRDFKMKYLGELPEQQQGNLAILSGAQLQLQNVAASLDRAQQQRVYLESLLSSYQRLAMRSGILPDAPGGPVRDFNPYQAAQAELASLESQRTKLAVTFRPQYPDVAALDGQIAAAQARVAKLRPSAGADQPTPNSPGEPAPPAITTPAAAEEDSSIAQVRSQLESNRAEIANLTKDEDRQKAVISEYQNRLNLTPVREQQLSGILRDYDLSKQDYADLLGKGQQSELAMSLEKQQGGEQFRLVNPPSLPNLPSSPNRLKLSLVGVAGGLALGLIAAVLIDLKNSVFHGERAVISHFSVPLVVSLPLIVTRRNQRRTLWIRAFEWVAGTAILAVVLAAEAWVYRHP